MAKRKMIVNTQKQTAEIWEDKKLLREFVVSTAKNGLSCEEGSYCTPTGTLRVAQKMGDGFPEGTVFKARIPTGEIWSKDAPNNFLTANEDLVLTRILWLEGTGPQNSNTLQRFIYLHGTNQEALLGTRASHGCIRFRNADILVVYDLLDVGSAIEIS